MNHLLSTFKNRSCGSLLVSHSFHIFHWVVHSAHKTEYNRSLITWPLYPRVGTRRNKGLSGRLLKIGVFFSYTESPRKFSPLSPSLPNIIFCLPVVNIKNLIRPGALKMNCTVHRLIKLISSCCKTDKDQFESSK